MGLISRNIKLTAAIPPGVPRSLHWGGEIKVCRGFAEAKIQGVELEKFGKDRLGSYPIHFHMDGDVANKHIVNANSIHHSYNKCVTVHSTNNLAVRNTVCARAVGHLFYEEIGDETNIGFENNLGLGAMSNDFAIKSSDDIKKYWWVGDNLAKINQYDGFNIPNTDKQDNPVHGGCFEPRADGGIDFKNPPPCAVNQLYVEPVSGFWILNPSTSLTDNSIGGCQGIGVGYWYLMPTVGDQKYVPVAPFKRNRVHGCYQGIFDENEFGVVVEPLLPRAPAQPPIVGKSVIARFDGFTATRNRDRAIWMRPTWFVFDNARLATNREAVTPFSSGGTDGNAPGVWTLLEDSVVVGLSRNNVDRFGPCPKNEILNTGCIDRNPSAKDEVERGYPTPAWNFAGYYIYDGPVRIEHDRFINFNIELNLTDDDQKFLADFTRYYYPASKGSYEGDAALGWFQNNQSAYPTTTVVKGLSFDNVDLRHQVFTDKVNFGSFADGDKNTAILDLDGSLTGFRVVNSTGTKVLENEAPISLNNLPINGASNAVDECLSKGGHDPALEGRPTSLISPGNVAVLEFGALWPPDPDKDRNRFDQLLTFTKDSKKPYGVHDTMDLHGRNGLGLWEPKVSSGYGYTVTAAVDPKAQVQTGKAGIPDFIDVGFTDAVQPGISPSNPFYIRLGVCYTDKNGNHPPNKERFTVKRGYKSWGGNAVYEEDKDLYFYWTKLFGKYDGGSGKQYCHNLDRDTRTCSVVNEKLICIQVNLDPVTGCPADGFTRFAGKSTDKCPNSGKDPVTINTIGGENVKICPYPKDPDLTWANFIDELKNADGTPVLNKYFYDPGSGMLFFNIVQDTPNALGPSPLGSCCDPTKFTCDPAENDPSCPDFNNKDVNKRESYYPCPPQGCITYTVRVASDNNYKYEPGPSQCGVEVSKGVFDIYKYNGGIFEQNPPADENKLAYLVPPGAKPNNKILDGQTVTPYVCKVTDKTDENPDCVDTKADFPHSAASLDPWCPVSPPK